MEKNGIYDREKADRIYTVRLEGMEFHAFHGVLDCEKKNGGDFVVDFEGDYASHCERTDKIEDAIDYSAIYKVVSRLMDEPRNLLETLASDICDVIADSFEGFSRIKVCVTKKNPPLEGKCSASAVCVERKIDRKAI